jgi:tRNA pseudouridine38-40 synthase
LLTIVSRTSERIILTTPIAPVVRYAVKFGYDGSAFEGYHRQKGMMTVEEAIIDAAKVSGIVKDVKAARLISASRTDRGVSAIGNVMAFDTDYKCDNIISNINSNLKSIWCWGIADVPEDFNPRHAVQRWYRYHLPQFLDMEIIQKGAALFVGEHDFLSYTRRAEGDTVREIDSIEVNGRKDFITVDFRAQRFLWNMVRRIVSALQRVERKIIGLEDIRASLKGGKKFNFGLADAEMLVLMDVSHDIDFEVQENSLDRLAKELNRSLFNVTLRKTFYENLRDAVMQQK